MNLRMDASAIVLHFGMIETMKAGKQAGVFTTANAKLTGERIMSSSINESMNAFMRANDKSKPEVSESELSDLLCVPKVELEKLEKARVDLYNFLEDKLSEWQLMQISNITGQIWRVANTKKWD